jgi:hypothetical protein
VGELAGLFLAWALSGASAARADEPGDLPLVAGPVVLGAAGAQIGPTRYHVVFAEGARVAHVRMVLPVATDLPGDVLLGFAARGEWRFRAEVAGVPVAVEAVAAPLPLAGGPFDEQVAVRVPVAAGGPTTVLVEAIGDTASVARRPELTYAQATFVLNRLLEPALARVVLVDPRPDGARLEPLQMTVETAAPQRPEGPVAGDVVAEEERMVLSGPVVADLAVPLEVAAVEGEYERPKNWGIVFGIGLALDWARLEYVHEDEDTHEVLGRWFYTPEFAEPASRVWFRGLFAYAWGPWMMETGLEGDFAGALEIPFTMTYFPLSGSPGFFDVVADWRLFGGLALQLINDRMPYDYGFDPRVFLRLGAGLRLFMFTVEAAYEIAPPFDAWFETRRGGC